MTTVCAHQIRWSRGGGAGRRWHGAGQSLGTARLDPVRSTSMDPVVQLLTDLDQMTQTIGMRMEGDQGILYFIQEAFVQLFPLGLFVSV